MMNSDATKIGIFSISVFLSAYLLFFIQPLFAKMMLPVIGGSPAVWATALAFYQIVLLLGYLYAHLIVKFLPIAVQIGIHLLFLIGVLFSLPLALPENWSLDAEANITLQALTLLAMGVGLPFAFLSSNSTLLQAWFSKTDTKYAKDPYFLYAASNFGSLLALVLFPVLAEIFFGVQRSNELFVLLIYAFAASFLIIILTTKFRSSSDTSHMDAGPPPNWNDKFHWIFLAMIPSAIMVGGTNHITQLTGSNSIYWILPLALYLVSFIIAFSGAGTGSRPSRGRLLIIAILGLSILYFVATSLSFVNQTVFALSILLLLLFTFFHIIIYRNRPSARHLTSLYLCMSIGGALGGIYVSFISPIVFNGSYELVILILTLLVYVAARLIARSQISGAGQKVAQALPIGAVWISLFLTTISFSLSGFDGKYWFAFAAILVAFYVAWSYYYANTLYFRTSLCFAITLPIFLLTNTGEAQYENRSFFAVHTVTASEERVLYYNGRTLHGLQLTHPDFRHVPQSYYHPSTPIGPIFSASKGDDHIAAIGLGVGSVACYAKPGQKWRFYEIDQMVVEIAKNQELFTFMSHCLPDAEVILGDGRLTLRNEEDHSLNIMYIDAFGSNSIPIHLLTIEAVAEFASKISEDGALIYHISNNTWDFTTQLTNAASEIGLNVWFAGSGNGELGPTSAPTLSQVILMSRDARYITRLDNQDLWQVMVPNDQEIWTDDRTNLLSALK